MPALVKGAREDGWAAAAAAIMTTDTFPKLATRQTRIGERTVAINGFLKGSGMIAPDMATMLAFVFTDAKIPGGVLQKLLADAADKSLNCVTVDGDTSTSDTLLMVATGMARHAPHRGVRRSRPGGFQARARRSPDRARPAART